MDSAGIEIRDPNAEPGVEDAAEAARLPAALPQRFLCREHSLGVAADEDGCCVTCGRDCAIVAVIVPFPETDEEEDPMAEVLHIRGQDNGECEVHDWTFERVRLELLPLMRARHGQGGVNVCVECASRWKLEADAARRS